MNEILRDRLTPKHEWKEYIIDFETLEGTFSFNIFALSFEHASYRLEELKASAKLIGEIVEKFDV